MVVLKLSVNWVKVIIVVQYVFDIRSYVNFVPFEEVIHFII